MRYYIITRQGYEHRYKQAREELGSIGIEPVKVMAFDGELLGVKPSSPHDLFADGSPHYMHPVQLATCLSHHLALRIALHDGDTPFVIFEDDVVVCDGAVDNLKAIEREMRGIDLVQLEYCCHEDKPKEQITAHLSRCQFPLCTAAILWTKKAAEFALSNMRPLKSPIDILMATTVYPFVSHAIATKMVFRQRNAPQIHTP